MERWLSEDGPALRQQVSDLGEQVRALSAKVEELTAKVREMSSRGAAMSMATAQDRAALPEISAGLQPLKVPALLSSLAAASFLLVIALILRTATEAGIMNAQLGAGLGLLYAFALFAVDHVRYSKARRAVPVYSVCGGLLVFAIVLENQAEFKAAFPPLGYGILAACLVIMVALGMRHGVPSLVWVGTLGASLAGVSLGFPEPAFRWLAVLLFLGNLAAYFVARRPECRWVKWCELSITLFFWLLWAIKLSNAFLREPETVDAFAPHGYLPMVTVFALYYLALSFRASSRSGGEPSWFESALPVITALWCYPAVRSVLLAQGSGSGAVSFAASTVALALVGAALWLARAEEADRRVPVAFVLSALLLAAVSVPGAVGGVALAAVLWCFAGLLVALLSWKWKSGVLRAVSYANQMYACVAALMAGGLFATEPLTARQVMVPLLMCAFYLAHYAWSRRREPAGQGILFSKFDPDDRSAVVLLIMGMLCGYAAVRAPWYRVSAALGGADTFQCGQSVLIHGAAVGLAVIGLARRNGERLIVAVLIALVGAIKVFAVDLFHLHGLPLVLSVFSFGVMAGLGALIWKTWQRAAQ